MKWLLNELWINNGYIKSTLKVNPFIFKYEKVNNYY